MGYIATTDLLGATTQYISSFGTQGVDFSLYSTPQLQDLINRVCNQIDGFCRQTFQLTNVQERYMGRGSNTMHLRKYPLAQIPDSVFGGSGSVSQSLVVDTTTTANNAKDDTVVAVADCSNVLKGQYLQWNDSSGEQGIEISAVSATSGAGNVTLKTALQYAHTSGTEVVVNTLDFIEIILPGQSFFPIPITQLVVDAEHGILINYTPLMFQNLGYATIFPKNLPLLVRYTYGYLAGDVPAVLQEVTVEQCRRWALKMGDPGPGGVSRWSLDDQSVSYVAWKPVTLDVDLADALGPFRRDIGFR